MSAHRKAEIVYRSLFAPEWHSGEKFHTKLLATIVICVLTRLDSMITRYKTAAPIPELIRLYEQRLLQCEQSPQQPLPDLAFFRQCRIAVIAAAAMRTRRAQSNRCIIGSPPRYRQQEPRSMPRSTASSRPQLSSALSRILVESWLPPRCREYTAA